MNQQHAPHLPTARLRHIRVGEPVILLIRAPGGAVMLDKPTTLTRTDQYYGYLENGIKASLCHLVATHNMVFGEHGWRVKNSC